MLQEIITDNMSTILVFLMVSLCMKFYIMRPKNIPPGPRLTLPIIGNLIQIGTNSVKSFREMRKKYGDVFSVYFGNRLVIAINGYDNIKEAFVKHSDIFSNRPHTFIVDGFSKNKGLIGSNGQVWKEQRKVAMQTLRNLGMGKNILEGNIKTEVTALIEELEKVNGRPIDIRHMISTSVSNVISALVFGKRFELDDPDFIKFLKILDQVAGTPVLPLFPFLRLLPGDPFKIKSAERDTDMILRKLVDTSLKEHLERYDEQNINDFISAYIKAMKEKEQQGDKNTSIDKDNLRITILNLFGAGTETTATTIRWLLLLFLHFPEIQEKCFTEIHEKIGCDRWISLKDKIELPYLNATILEILRYANIVPFGVRTVPKDTIFKGYLIPEGAVVMPVIDSVLMDPKIWGDPENFRPERFLDDNGRLSKREENIPFLIGPRNCIGESLARMELFLFLATMIQKFKFTKAEEDYLPTLRGHLGIVYTPTPFNIKVTARK